MKMKNTDIRFPDILHGVRDKVQPLRVLVIKKLKSAVQDSHYGPEIALAFIIALQLVFMAGCSGLKASSDEQIKKFKETEPITAVMDATGSAKTRLAYTYRVIPGDVLEFEMPAILRELSSDTPNWLGKVEPYSCRVAEDGTITLPIVGKVSVVGTTLAEVESSVVDAYYPKYVVNVPGVVCKVTEHLNERVFTVLGLVAKRNAFPYPPNVQYNLMEALAFAGGVDSVANPHYVGIYRQGANGEIVQATFRIDKEFLADAYDVVIKPGDVVYVKKTVRTSMNTFLADVLRLNVGAYVRPLDD